MNQALRELFKPALRLFSICALAALVLGAVFELTKDMILHNQQAEERQALQRLTQDGEKLSERLKVMPLAIGKAEFEEQLLPRISSDKARELLHKYYLPEIDSYRLRTPLVVEDIQKLMQLFTELDFENREPVRGCYLVKQEQELIAYVLEVAGSGFGGEMKIFVVLTRDGKVRQAVLTQNRESPAQRKKAEAEGYMDKFIGRRGMSIPTIKSMLTQAEADAVSGASVTFMGIAQAIRAASLWVLAVEGNE